MRWGALVLASLAVSGLGHRAASAQLRDLGAFGPTCPIAGPEAPRRPSMRLSLAERPPERLTVTTRLELAPSLRRQRVLQGPGAWPAGAPSTLAFVGTDPASLEIIRALPPGSGVYLVSMRSWQDVRVVQGLCPGCLVQPGSDATAALFGLTHYPAVVRWTGRELVVTEGL